MGKKLFRYIFENVPNAVVFDGCMWDKKNNKKLLFTYSCEIKRERTAEMQPHAFLSKKPVDLFIMGEFTISDCRRLLCKINNNGVKQIILPYVTPEKRKQLLRKIKGRESDNPELFKFIQDPDEYLKGTSVQKYYYISGNGNEKLSFEEGVKIHLEQYSELLSRIISIEGKELPLRKAGGFSQNQMYFYLSDCGQEFGSSKLALFCMPLETEAEKMDSVFQAFMMDSAQDCSIDMSEDDCNCAVKCMLYRDHAVFRHAKDRRDGKMRMGALLSGCIESDEQMEQLRERMGRFMPRVRIFSMLPGLYSMRILNEIAKEQKRDELYCVCPEGLDLSADSLKEILFHNPRNRIVGLSEKYGCCLNGYLSDKEDNVL